MQVPHGSSNSSRASIACSGESAPATDKITFIEIVSLSA
jgi:hypothetical protein